MIHHRTSYLLKKKLTNIILKMGLIKINQWIKVLDKQTGEFYL
jgi:hypothetical protein